MEITREKQGAVTILSVQGRLEVGTAETFEQKLLELIQQGELQLLVDLSELNYISSIGLRVFLMASKRLKDANGKIVLAALQDHIKKVFFMSAFNRILPILNTREEAMREF